MKRVFRCNKNLYMRGSRDKVFTNGQEYVLDGLTGISWLIDNHGTPHGIGDKWMKHFTEVTKHKMLKEYFGMKIDVK